MACLQGIPSKSTQFFFSSKYFVFVKRTASLSATMKISKLVWEGPFFLPAAVFCVVNIGQVKKRMGERMQPRCTPDLDTSLKVNRHTSSSCEGFHTVRLHSSNPDLYLVNEYFTIFFLIGNQIVLQVSQNLLNPKPSLVVILSQHNFYADSSQPKLIWSNTNPCYVQV